MAKKKRLTAEQRRISIIEATIQVVATLNYDRATTALIAKEAKINQALIYKHFKSKRDLQIAMLDHIRGIMSENYDSNPELAKEVEKSSFYQAITIQYHSQLKSEILLRACVLKAMVAIDRKIRAKAWEIVKENHEFLRASLEEDYRSKTGNAEFDAEMMAWSAFASDMLFTGLSLMDKIDEISTEKIFDSVRSLERVLFGIE